LLVPVVLAALVCGVSTASAAHSSGDACRAGSKRAVIGGKVKCLRAGQACRTRYQSGYKKYGFTCVAGHLRKRTAPKPPPEPTPPPPPPTPAPPPAQPGHYKGTSSQLTVVEFDVRSDGRAVTSLTTGQVNQGCTPPGHLFGGGLQDASTPVASDSSFVVAFDLSGSFSDGTPYSGHYNLTGHFSGATATGTISVTTNFTDNGTAYSCGSGVQTWTASRVS